MIVNVLLKPEVVGGSIKIKDQLRTNFKLIASVIWMAFIKYIRTVCKAKDPENDDEFLMKNGRKYRKAPTDVISEELFDDRDLSHIFQREKKWFTTVCIRIAKFLETFINLTKNSDKVKKAQEAS